MTRTALFSLLSASTLLGSSLADTAPDAATLQKMTARFAPVDIGAETVSYTHLTLPTIYSV